MMQRTANENAACLRRICKRSDQPKIENVWPWFSCGTVFLYRGNDTIFWIFPIVPCHAFCMWHWPIGKDLDLSFIWDHHHLHLVGLWISVNQLHTSQLATPCWRDPIRSKQLSTVAIWLSFGLYRVIASLSFQRSISLASLFISIRSLFPVSFSIIILNSLYCIILIMFRYLM